MTKGKEMEVPEDLETVTNFLHRSDPFRQLHYSVLNGKVGNMLDILLKRHYTLLIANIPYGFQITGSMYDDVPYKYPQIEKMVKDFAKLILAPINIISSRNAALVHWCITLTHPEGTQIT